LEVFNRTNESKMNPGIQGPCHGSGSVMQNDDPPWCGSELHGSWCERGRSG